MWEIPWRTAAKCAASAFHRRERFDAFFLIFEYSNKILNSIYITWMVLFSSLRLDIDLSWSHSLCLFSFFLLWIWVFFFSILFASQTWSCHEKLVLLSTRLASKHTSLSSPRRIPCHIEFWVAYTLRAYTHSRKRYVLPSTTKKIKNKTCFERRASHFIGIYRITVCNNKNRIARPTAFRSLSVRCS